MAAQVLSFFQRSPRLAPIPADWTQQELAEFYRVEGALIRAGIRVGTDRGMSDENEPWFVFYRSDDGEVVIHFARIDGQYLIAGPAYEEIARGFDFTALVRNLVERHPLIRRPEGGNLSIHPAALLVAVVGTAFFKTGEARAAETGATTAQSGHSRPVLLSSSASAPLTTGVAPAAAPQVANVQLPANEAVLVLAAALLASDYSVAPSSLSDSARGAIASAAAALDFTGTTSHAAVAATALPFDTSSHATTVDNTPVQTVSTVLSLIAILSTQSQALIPVATGAVADALQTVHYQQDINLSPSHVDTGNWSIDVRLDLSSGGLPSVEAAQLVRGILGEASYQKVSVIEVTKLPDVLAEIIERSTHYTTTPTTTLPDTPTPPPTIPVGGSGETGGSDTPSTGGSTPHTTPDAPKPDQPAFASPEIVKQFVDYFVSHTAGVDIVVNGSEIIMLDSNVLHNMKAIAHLDSMTFDFADGSSISLVGDHSSFLHTGNLS